MSSTGKKYFSEEFRAAIWKPLICGVKEAKTDKEFVNFLDKILTPQEKITIEKRLAILFLLPQGKSYKEISDIVDTHYSTISFVKKGFKKSVKKPKQNNYLKKEEDLFDFAKKKKFPTFRPYRFIPKSKRK
ncbi:MAG: helix-turn-helix domain-containing protein [Patescibacteria group bacterium]